jgi:hypothetical protein
MAIPRCCAASLALTLLLFASSASAAEPEKPAQPSGDSAATVPAATVPAAAVPLARVVLFSSGVGFFDRQGEVDGDAAVALKFSTSDINDLLKSLVLEDRGGGQISAVTYGSKDPITKTLQKFAVDLTANPTLSQILNQIRGERIEFIPAGAQGVLTGTLLGVETRKREVGPNHATIDVEIMNLLTDAGLRSEPLDQIGPIKIVNPQLDKEFRQALAVLALGHDADKKSVTLHFDGKGKRPVRVGYIQNMPIWKTSYRLSLAADDAKPMLQGWAIVENTTEEDWQKVKLTLVSGRPVSFIMNLYDPLYVQRPTVEPELFAGLRPQVYGQGLDDDSVRLGRVGESDRKMKVLVQESPADPSTYSHMITRSGREPDGSGDSDDMLLGAQAVQSFDLSKGFGPQKFTESGEVGELFQYSIVPPVTLARQESAMLPVVNEHVGAKKVSVYNPAVQAKHPLSGLRLTNTTDLHLMQGPITVFDGGTYAGDARIEDIAPGGERLLTYALDLDVECIGEATGTPAEIASIRLAKGILYAERKQVLTVKYKLKNSGQKKKTILVEQPFETDWRLVAPKEPTERTRDLYRFAVDVEPGKTETLEIVIDHPLAQQIEIANADDATIRLYESQQAISPEVKAALEKIVALKIGLAGLVEQRKKLEQQLKAINEEQQRIRQNMPQLDRNSDLYKRYVKKLGDQEDAVEKLGVEIERLSQEETKARKALDDFLLALDLK